MQDESAEIFMDLGYRYSDYSTKCKFVYGGYKAGINWQPMETMTIDGF